MKPNVFLPFDKTVSIKLGMPFLRTLRGGGVCATLLLTITPEAEMLTAVVSGSKDLGDGKISVFVARIFRAFKKFLL